MSRLLSVGPSPHIQGGVTTRGLMLDVLIALLPAWVLGVIYFGLPALWLTLVCVGSSVVFEYVLMRWVLRRDPTVEDLSACVTGLLLAMNLPANIPLWIAVLGSLLAIGVCKVSFGGLGNNLFNPALFARAFLLISFPVQMTSWPLPLQGFVRPDGVTGATPLGLLKGALYSIDGVAGSGVAGQTDLLYGLTGGSFGEVASLALIVGGLYLLFRRVITWHIPVSILVTAGLFALIGWLVDGVHYPDPLMALTTGGLLLGAIFMATDYVTSPMSSAGMIIFGVGIGALTMIIRFWGAYPEGVSFAILIMNAFVPLINKYVKPKKFGHSVRLKRGA